MTETSPIKGGPIPSYGDLQDHLRPNDPPKRPAGLAWTPELLRHIMISFLIPLIQRPDQPFGPLSIRLSGSKPDPFLALIPPRALVTHEHLPPDKQGQTPVRVETGDHIRVYCNIKSSLALRTWLHGIEVDRSAIKAGAGVFRPFNRVRLVLVGGRGECLTVA